MSLPPQGTVVCLGGLLIGSLLGAGCTPSSSGPSPTPDTTAASTATSSPAESPTESTSASSVASSPPEASSRTVAQRLDDASVTARVKQALVRTRALRPFNFSPTVVRGHLTLQGEVDTREQYRQAERIASNVEGVADVTNHVTVDGRSVSTTYESEEAEDVDDATFHTVRRGDTLIEIARAYGVSVRQLRALNDLSGSLQPGQRIRVR